MCVGLSKSTFMDLLIVSSDEPDEAGCSCYLHLIDLGWGFESLSDLVLDHRRGRDRRQDTKPEPHDQSLCLHNSGGGGGALTWST